MTSAITEYLVERKRMGFGIKRPVTIPQPAVSKLWILLCFAAAFTNSGNKFKTVQMFLPQFKADKLCPPNYPYGPQNVHA